MNQAVGNHSVEGRGDFQVVFDQLLGAHGGLGGADRLQPGIHQGSGGVHLLFGDGEFVAGDDPRCFRGFLEFVVSALRAGQLRFGLYAVALGGLYAGLGFGDASGHLGSG